jgi:hypothetical protein
MMLKHFVALAILSHSAFCQFASNDRQLPNGDWQYCEEECNRTCIPCEIHNACNVPEEKFCSYGPERVADNGLPLPHCPRNENCVNDDCFCPEVGNDGNLCPVVCTKYCSETEILCDGGKDENDCLLQDICVDKGYGHDNVLCEGYCEVSCTFQELKCPEELSNDGCARPEYCHLKQKDYSGHYCQDQQCPQFCQETQNLCSGDFQLDGCQEGDKCVLRQAAPHNPIDHMCPGTCPVTCQNGEINCQGTIDYLPGDHLMCEGQSVCHIKARDINTLWCEDSSASHGCPVTCPDHEILCPPKESPLGCLEEQECTPRTKDHDTGAWCPSTSDCPTVCPPFHVNCPGGVGDDGCKNPDLCIKQHRDFNGDLCPVHCPENCDDDQVFCPGTRSPINGCFSADKCEDKGEHIWGETPGDPCPGWCPGICNDNEVLCPSMIDPCNGCPTEEICREAIKDKNNEFCPGKEYTIHKEGEDYREYGNRRGGYLSSSHNCPVYCREDLGEVSCPTYENELGCKPEAYCMGRPKAANSEEWCPSTSVCPKECPSHQHLCHYEDGDETGCKHEDVCINRQQAPSGALCTDVCPPICTAAQTFQDNGVDDLGCQIAATCV